MYGNQRRTRRLPLSMLNGSGTQPHPLENALIRAETAQNDGMVVEVINWPQRPDRERHPPTPPELRFVRGRTVDPGTGTSSRRRANATKRVNRSQVPVTGARPGFATALTTQLSAGARKNAASGCSANDAGTISPLGHRSTVRLRSRGRPHAVNDTMATTDARTT
jgi:hypothetical protein